MILKNHSLIDAMLERGMKKIHDILFKQGGLRQDLAQQINFGDTLIALATHDEKIHRVVLDAGFEWHTQATFKKISILRSLEQLISLSWIVLLFIKTSTF